VLGHELIELFLVLGVAQPIEEILEFGLLLLETLQRLDAVFVEGAVAAAGRRSSLSLPRATILSVSSANGRCSGNRRCWSLED
jgi:hypothetical protein